MITVSMPVYETPAPLLRRAVDSVLAQTYGDFRLVVVNDGGSNPFGVLADIDDPRLVTHSWDRNRGRYYTDAVVAWATDTEWFTAHDSDDWSDPDRFETLRKYDTDTVAGAVVWHYTVGRKFVHRPNLASNPRFRLRWHNSALYRTARVRDWLHPGFQMSWDQATSMLAHRYGTVSSVNRPLYHWCQRPGSLTQAAATRRGTPIRVEQNRRARTVYEAHIVGDSTIPKPDPDDIATIRAVLGVASRP